jgi:DNA-binding ferritin-like protein
MSIEKQVKNKLLLDLEITKAGHQMDKEAERDEEMAATSLASMAQCFESQGLPDVAQRAREDGVKEVTQRKERLEKSTAHLQRLVNLLKDPDRLKRISAIAQKALEKNE